MKIIWQQLTINNGNQNPVANLLVSVLPTLIKIDYNIRRKSHREGVARAKAEGKYNGRANGTGLSDRELIAKQPDILHDLLSASPSK